MKLIKPVMGGALLVACGQEYLLDGETDTCLSTHFQLIRCSDGTTELKCRECDERWTLQEALEAQEDA